MSVSRSECLKRRGGGCLCNVPGSRVSFLGCVDMAVLC